MVQEIYSFKKLAIFFRSHVEGGGGGGLIHDTLRYIKCLKPGGELAQRSFPLSQSCISKNNCQFGIRPPSPRSNRYQYMKGYSNAFLRQAMATTKKIWRGSELKENLN